MKKIELILASSFDASKITGQMQQGGAFQSTTTAIEGAGNSAIYIMMMIVGFIAVIGLLIAVLKIMVGGSMTKNEAKGSLFWIMVAGIIGFGAIGIVGLLQTIGNGLFSTTAVPAALGAAGFLM